MAFKLQIEKDEVQLLFQVFLSHLCVSSVKACNDLQYVLVLLSGLMHTKYQPVPVAKIPVNHHENTGKIYIP
jgi:hypothetical protein